MHLFFVLLSMVKYFREPSANLFDRIILAIKKEQETRQTRRILFGFLFLLVASLVATPVSWAVLANQAGRSGITYFISTAASDLGAFFVLWQNFSLAIIESLPMMGIIVFVISINLALFTIRLFLYKKRLLVGYLLHRI